MNLTRTGLASSIRRKYAAQTFFTGPSSFLQEALTKEYREEKRLRFSPEEMYHLVQDVDDYKNFVPWCSDSRVSSSKPLTPASYQRVPLPGHLSWKTDHSTKCTHKKATLQVGFNNFQNVSYLSNVYCWEGLQCRHRRQSAVRLVEAQAADGDLFDLLVSRWTFYVVPDQPKFCHVEFDIKFRFKSILHAQASQLFFSQVCQAMVQAFEKRASVRYKR